MTTVVLHGAGSSARAAREFIGSALPEGATYLEDRTGDIATQMAMLDATAEEADGALCLVGISLGAHVIAMWLSRDIDRCAATRAVLILPAWTGAPGDVAAYTSSTADRVLTEGRSALLLDIESVTPSHAVVPGLVSLAWDEYTDDTLARCLRQAASGRGPTLDELARVPVHCTVVAWTEDPMHPESVGRQWAGALQDAELVIVPAAHSANVGDYLVGLADTN